MILGAVMGSETGPGSPLGPLAVAPLISLPIVVAMYIDMTRRSELLFLANLGHSFRGIAIAIVAECAVLEIAIRVAVA